MNPFANYLESKCFDFFLCYLDVLKACVAGWVLPAASARSLSNFVADLVLFSGLFRKDRFEKKKEARREGLCWAWAPGTGVLGAESRRHAFSYDVSARKKSS